MAEHGSTRPASHSKLDRVAHEQESLGTAAEAVRVRRRWFSVLSSATAEELEAAWERAGCRDVPTWVRPPETGLVMVRGRMGATGAPFHLGEMTATRCVVALGTRDEIGYGCVAGRDRRKAELVALLDALLQREPASSVEAGSLWRLCLEPIEARQAADAGDLARQVAQTKVDFFTMVRGEG